MARAVTVIEGLPQLQRRLAAITNVGDVSEMRAVGEEFAASAKRLAPYDPDNTRYPHLRDSIRVANAGVREAIIVAGGEERPAARSVERSAPAHQITPRTKRRLGFFWKNPPPEVGPPGMYSFRKVNHPATAAQPFFQPVVDTINLATPLKARIVARWNGAA